MTKPVLPFLALGLAGIVVATAAAQDLAPPAPGEPGSLEWHNTQQAALHGLSHANGWTTLADGVKFRRTAGDGSGAAPTVQDRITIHYTGSFTDGSVFDSSVERGEPATFRLGGLIRGWQIAIPYMGVGDTAEIAIPADAAYGVSGRGPIPGNATLFFTIELLAIPSQSGAAASQ